MQKKYLNIYHDLVKKIEMNVWPAATKIPSENELSKIYATSRETIRKALNLLSQSGYIQKIRGKGSVIIGVNKFDFPVSGIISFKELTANLNLKAKTWVEELSLKDIDDEEIAGLKEPGHDNVWKVVRAREISGEKIILDKDYFSTKYVPSLSQKVCEDSIYDYLENELELVIGFARKEIVVEEPTEEDRQLLDLEGFSNVAVIKSQVYLADASLFQYTESRHRPDKFRFVDFARRIKN
ncbi:trehalose operon repressor [Virgibacillus indicus]|uniref:Trehalose operon repressor n=1 Tax=Virgibacillus indicus TaxID=2024554 RepID=A0A265NAU6_9BACI|nr:trehalose operon repressor [Virgibacillus indicus]OZU89148.1 trehalose operon repressor [Virgibacillus indicus]